MSASLPWLTNMNMVNFRESSVRGFSSSALASPLPVSAFFDSVTRIFWSRHLHNSVIGSSRSGLRPAITPATGHAPSRPGAAPRIRYSATSPQPQRQGFRATTGARSHALVCSQLGITVSILSIRHSSDGRSSTAGCRHCPFWLKNEPPGWAPGAVCIRLGESRIIRPM